MDLVEQCYEAFMGVLLGGGGEIWEKLVYGMQERGRTNWSRVG